RSGGRPGAGPGPGAGGLFPEGGAACSLLNRPADGEKKLRECLEVARPIGERHPCLAVIHFQLALAQSMQKKDAEAEQNLRASLDIARSAVGLTHPHVVKVVDGLARVLVRRGKADEADRLFAEYAAAHRKRFGPTHPTTADALVHQADYLFDRGPP